MINSKSTRYTVFYTLLTFILLAFASSDAHHPVRNIDMTYKVTFDGSGKLWSSDKVDIWIPLAASGGTQEIYELKIEGIDNFEITEDVVWGNSMIYFTSSVDDLPGEIFVRYKAKIREHRGEREKNNNENLREKFLKPSTLALHSDRVRRISKSLAKDYKDADVLARVKYDFILENMQYNKEATKRGDVESLCISIEGGKDGHGNCTDYHSIFTSLLQTRDIPARLFMGIPLHPDGGNIEKGYHCWAEFLSDNGFWYPVDISEADKNPSKKDFYFKSLDHDRFYFSMGRDITLNPPQKGKPLNFFGPYPYGESNGLPYSGFTTTISYN